MKLGKLGFRAVCNVTIMCILTIGEMKEFRVINALLNLCVQFDKWALFCVDSATIVCNLQHALSVMWGCTFTFWTVCVRHKHFLICSRSFIMVHLHVFLMHFILKPMHRIWLHVLTQPTAKWPFFSPFAHRKHVIENAPDQIATKKNE